MRFSGTQQQKKVVNISTKYEIFDFRFAKKHEDLFLLSSRTTMTEIVREKNTRAIKIQD